MPSEERRCQTMGYDPGYSHSLVAPAHHLCPIPKFLVQILVNEWAQPKTSRQEEVLYYIMSDARC